MSLETDPIITLEHTTTFFRIMHGSDKCSGEYCTIHNRSNHAMRTFPQLWRGDKGIMERICPHGIGHPDPDEIAIDTTHGCDGCCKGEQK
jgi:hypothetical protein